MNLNGKVAIVTGAAGGIGRATVDRFVDAGATVLAADLPGTNLTFDASTVMAVEADVTRADDAARVVEEAERAFGGLDMLVNNAGIEGAVAPLTECPEEAFDRVISVNLKGVWLGMKHAAPAMSRRGGGSIANVSSVAGLRASMHLIAYVASKHAVIGMTRTAAIELAPANIRVNAICPSPVETRMMRSIEEGWRPRGGEDVHAQVAAMNPMGRYAEPAEVAAVIMFVSGAHASYINGAAIPVDGGLTAR